MKSKISQQQVAKQKSSVSKIKTSKDKGSFRQIYQLKVNLVGSRPPIWRRVLVPGDIALSDLHFVIQKVMGWWNSHLHQFSVGGEEYSDPEFEIEDVKNEKRVRLRDVVSEPKDSLLYEYDFGDGWEHKITIEKIMTPDKVTTKLPLCVNGARACPPEDCGGMWGYQSFLAAIADPKHEEHKAMLEWIGEPFDPEWFDVEEVNKSFR